MAREALQFSEVAIKLTALGFKNSLALALAYAKENPKVRGKTSLDRLLRENKELKVIPIKTEDAGISENELLRQTAAAVAVEVCGRLGLPMPPDAFQTLEGMKEHIPDGEERRALEKVREMAVTFGDAVCKRLKLERGQPAPQREER